MNDNELDSDLEDLPTSSPTLRRQNAITSVDDINQRFFDTETHEIVCGNPDISHSSNKNLIKLQLWQSGRCNPNLFFCSRKNEYDDVAGMNAIVVCNA